MKLRITLILTISFLFFSSIQGYAQPKKCPVLRELEQTSIKDGKEVVKALNTIIPKVYGIGIAGFPDMYTKWNIVTVKPFPKTVGDIEKGYFGMAKTFCGKEIADKSWLVRLDFPKAPGADLSQGQLFLAKNKEEGWFVWFKYH